MDSLLSELEAEVLSRQTTLAAIFDRYGSESISQYVRSWEYPKNPPDAALIEIIQSLATELYGEEAGLTAAAQLKEVPMVSTIDHHGLLNHPFFINSNLICSLWPWPRYVICLTTAGISLNNSSWPAALAYHEQGKLRRISLFRDRDKTQAVLAKAPFGRWEIERVRARLPRSREQHAIRSVLESLLSECEQPDVLNLPSFWRQGSVLSKNFWNRFFPEAPEVLAIPIEIVTAKFLIAKLTDERSTLARLLLEPVSWPMLERHFQGMHGAFSGPRKGSFLFWGLSPEGRRIHLSLRGGFLAGDGCRIRLKAKDLIKALEDGRIYPSSLLCFMVMLLGELACIGGFNQVNWLTGIKAKFSQLLEEMGEAGSAQKVRQQPSDLFAESALAFLPGSEGLVKASGADILIAGANLYQKYAKLSEQLTVKESIRANLAEMYAITVPLEERDKRRAAITERDVLKNSGIEDKIRAALG